MQLHTKWSIFHTPPDYQMPSHQVSQAEPTSEKNKSIINTSENNQLKQTQ